MAISEVDRCGHGGTNFTGLGLPRPEAESGHHITIVQSDGRNHWRGHLALGYDIPSVSLTI